MHFAVDDESLRELIDQLARRIRKLEHAGRPRDRGSVTSGCGPLDRLLPERGFARGSLVEWLSTGLGGGASTLALLAAREASRERGVVAVINRHGKFYPPAAVAWGIEPVKMIVVRPGSLQDEQWALDQVLRSEHVAAALAWPDRLDARTFRRLRLAAEHGGGLGLLVRGEAARAEPSWADVRLLVQPRAGAERWQLCVEVLRCRGHHGGEVAELEIDERTGTIHEASGLHLAAELAAATSEGRQARA